MRVPYLHKQCGAALMQTALAPLALATFLALAVDIGSCMSSAGSCGALPHAVVQGGHYAERTMS
jgi:hypothetical protein